MTIDPYRVLGIAPDADEATLRSAYRQRMKHFHPDQNRSEDAAERAREVAAAYALLSDPAQRSRHDRERELRTQIMAPAPPPPAPRAPRARAGGLLMVLLSAGIIGVGLSRFDPGPRPASLAAAPATKAPDEAANVPSRVAPSTASSPEAPPTKVAQTAPAPLPVEMAPVAIASAAPPLLPPATAAVATRAAEAPAAASRIAPQPPLRPTGSPPIRVATTTPPPAADDCTIAATCARIDLAALQRMQGLLDTQSYLNAPPAKQARLMETRSAFVARLGRCLSAACKRDAYLDRNREVAALMRD